MIRKVEISSPPNLLDYEPGYTGAFTRERAEGALPNGTRVKKVRLEPGDHHNIGEHATILGSIREPYGEYRIMYFVEWDAMPKHAVACIAWKLDKVERSL